MRSREMRRTRSLALVVATCLLCLARPSFCDAVAVENSKPADNIVQQQPKPHQHEELAVAESPKSNIAKSNNDDNNKSDATKSNNDDNKSDATKSKSDNKNDVAKSKSNKTAAAPAAAIVDTKANPGKTAVTSNDKTPTMVKLKTDAADTEIASNTPEHSEIGRTTSLNPGAFLRGFYVFVGLSVLALAYMVFRSFRLNKSRTQMVRKYGVLAHKQDIEMRPLPLDENDEDDTVFDASGFSLSSTLSRSHS